MRSKSIFLGILFTGLSIAAVAQQKITVEDFTTKPTFQTKTITGINWMSDGKFYTSLKDNKVEKFSIFSGASVEVIFDGAANGPISISDYTFSSDEKKLLIATEMRSIYRRSYTAEYYVYDIASKKLTRLSENGKQSYAAFSPDGTKVAFVRENNLFYVNLADWKETQITDDGKFNHIINGTTDWVYEEEFGFVVGFFWSPDSKNVAYYCFDESRVKEYNMQVWGKKAYPFDYRFKYPKAGEANSFVELWFYSLNDGKKVKADLGSERDMYIPRARWTANANLFSAMRLNRLQNHVEILHINPSTGSSTVVLEDKSKAYIDIEYVDDIHYFADGKRFVSTSEKSGYKHIYLNSIDGKSSVQVTRGEFDVISLVGVDERGKRIFYTSTEPSSQERHLYSIGFDGKGKLRMTNDAGQHHINMSNDFQYYIDHYSNGSKPPVATLYVVKGNKASKVLESNEALVATTRNLGVVPKEFFTFKTEQGNELHGYFLKPSNFDSNKKYPVLLYQYSGPGSQNAGNSWAGSHFWFHQMLVQSGYIVAVVDPRGTGGRGEAFRKLTYKQLGKYELEDLVFTAKYLSSLSFVDGDRLGIWGWSYGGYMTALAMTKGAGAFKLGVAVAPVTNWRFYDTIYTERYLQTPQLNASGYDDNSPLTHAASLKGKFLLIHGTGDDNVHFQNSVLFQAELINAGKQFDSFYYPDKHHGIQGATTRQHLYNQILAFIQNNL